jgi:hypothetical protein
MQTAQTPNPEYCDNCRNELPLTVDPSSGLAYCDECLRELEAEREGEAALQQLHREQWARMSDAARNRVIRDAARGGGL